MRDILPVVVDGLWRQGAKNLAVRLVSADGQPLPAWAPGAHIDLHLPCGLIRQYSLTGSPAGRDHYLLCVAREAQSRGGSRYIHDTLRPGQPLLISAPRNRFPLHGGGHVVLLAAGIGITPLLAMAHARAASGASFTLHYYVSRAQEAAFATEIASQLTGGTCLIHSSADGQSPRLRLAQDLGAPDADTRVYFCGPPGFMAQVRDTALAAGWAETQLHSEAFQPTVPTAASAEDGTFTITLASTGERWPVPGDKTIARVLQEHGVEVPLSCEMGICGACLTPVREGTVDHRDTVQSEAEKQAAEQHIALCCSRSLSANLVIDLAG
ncbi:TPA: molybdenum cofactor-independent xanthine hydroxylase subunit HpxE [Klebsiella quasipneumoniae subsp. similipneumoniae]|nr:molybdenum cofactor-independent xanthine hydroxylase subunit HpxE [Klebsiella quasipneumoniae subsp. similipneumoniae]